MARFSMLIEEDLKKEGKEVLDFNSLDKNKLLPEDKELLKNLNSLIGSVTTNLEKYRFSDAADGIYQFMWHEVADKYIEAIKNRSDKETALSVFGHVFRTGLKLLHPFMPFISEAIWDDFPKNSKESKDLVNTDWPTVK
jgi:valyl-tRNA synthetase